MGLMHLQDCIAILYLALCYTHILAEIYEYKLQFQQT